MKNKLMLGIQRGMGANSVQSAMLTFLSLQMCQSELGKTYYWEHIGLAEHYSSIRSARKQIYVYDARLQYACTIDPKTRNNTEMCNFYIALDIDIGTFYSSTMNDSVQTFD